MEPATFFRLLRGALRAVQLYPPDSPVGRRAVAALHRAVADLASGRPEGVSVCFLEDGAFLEGRPAGMNAAGDEPGLAPDLYAVGLRELRFLDGVTVEEVERLLRPLARALLGQLNPVDEDLSLQLWEEDLPHITYCLYEESPAEEAPPPVDTLPPTPDPGIEAFLAEGSPFPAESRSAAWFRLSEEERMRILTAYRQEEEPDAPYKFGRLLLEILRTEKTTAEVAQTAVALREHLDGLARDRRIHSLRRLRERIEPGVAASPAAAAALGEVVARLDDPARLSALLGVGETRAEDRAAARAIAVDLPAETAHALCALLDDKPGSLDPAVAGILQGRLATDHALQHLCLTGSRPALRRLALEWIVPREDEIRFLRELRNQPDTQWRLLAVGALARGVGSATLAGLAEALDDEQVEIRMAATEALGRRGGHAALEPLLRTVTSRGFGQRSFEERRRVLLSAGQASPREVWPVLARLVERRRFCLAMWRNWSDEPALEALARLPDPVPGLLQERWRRRGDLRRALARARSRAGEEPVCPAPDVRGDGPEQSRAA